MNNEYLQILELEPGASEDDIRTSYRRLAKKYHPDITKNESSREQFIKVTEAYKFLTEAGPRPYDQNIAYNYDPSQQQYDYMREQAKAYARQQAYEEALAQKQNMIKIYEVFKYVVIAILLFQASILIDFFLPAKTSQEVVEQISENYVARQGKVEHVSDNIILASRIIVVPPKAAEGIGNQRVTLHFTPIFQIFKYGETEVNYENKTLKPNFTVLTILKFLVPFGIIVGIVFFLLQDAHPNKITILILIIISFFIIIFLSIKELL